MAPRWRRPRSDRSGSRPVLLATSRLQWQSESHRTQLAARVQRQILQSDHPRNGHWPEDRDRKIDEHRHFVVAATETAPLQRALPGERKLRNRTALETGTTDIGQCFAPTSKAEAQAMLRPG